MKKKEQPLKLYNRDANGKILKYDKRKEFYQLTTILSIGFLKDGGTISRGRTFGGSTPWSFCLISHIARANCSLFNLPL